MTHETGTDSTHDASHSTPDTTSDVDESETELEAGTLTFPKMFHCTPCGAILPASAFYHSNLERCIHRCKKHTREAAARSKQKQRLFKEQQTGDTVTAVLAPSATRMAAKRTTTLLRRLHKVRRSIMKPDTSLPAWTRNEDDVYAAMKRFGGKSVVSGTRRSLVLLPVVDTMAVWEDPATKWEASNAAPVSMNEAYVILMGDEQFSFAQDVVQKVSST